MAEEEQKYSVVYDDEDEKDPENEGHPKKWPHLVKGRDKKATGLSCSPVSVLCSSFVILSSPGSLSIFFHVHLHSLFVLCCCCCSVSALLIIFSTFLLLLSILSLITLILFPFSFFRNRLYLSLFLFRSVC